MDIDNLLYKLNNESDLEKRRYIPDKLAKLGDWKSTIPLGELILDESQPTLMRNEAVESLGKQGDPRAVQYLTQVLEDPDDEIRRTAVWSLGQIGTPKTLKPIFSKTDDENPEVRRWVAKSAGRIRHDDVVVYLEKYFRATEPKSNQRVLADILRAFTTQISRTTYKQRQFLTDRCQKLLELDIQGYVKQAAVFLLAECIAKGSLPDTGFLKRQLRETVPRDPLIRPGLIQALGHAGEKQVLRELNSNQALVALGFADDARHLADLLKGEDDPDRLKAILEGIFHTFHLPDLHSYLIHDNLSVRQQALAIHAKHQQDITIVKKAYKEGRGTNFILGLFKYYGSPAIPIYRHSALEMNKVARQYTVHALISPVMIQYTQLHPQIKEILEQVDQNDRIWHIRRDARIGLERIEEETNQ